MEFWERSFREKQEMWGWEPADSAAEALELFNRNGLNTLLIPGIGYGRNAKIFTDKGFNVTGIEISETAIDIAKKYFGDKIKIYHGSVHSMPFNNELYDGIFCYALIHLLNAEERIKLIKDCYHQLKPNGYMVFTTISNKDSRFGQGEEISKNTFETKHGVNLYFYDSDAINNDFGHYGLLNVDAIKEQTQQFCQIVCKKECQ